MLDGIYVSTQEETRYSPAECVVCARKQMMGNPDPVHVSTSSVERQNLFTRTQRRRFTRLTNAFSKNAENHAAVAVLCFAYYNWVRIHQTLRVTRAMEADLKDYVWTIEEMLEKTSNRPTT